MDSGLKAAFLPLEKLARLVRFKEWWYSKIPPLLAMAYLEQSKAASHSFHLYQGLLVLLFSAACVASFVHAINDWTDMDQDLAAGKPNAFSRVPQRWRWAVLLLMAGLGLIPWLFVPLPLLSQVALALIYLLALLYSVPPARLKERGFWGVCSDACMVHGLPSLFVLAYFCSLNRPGLLQLPILTFATGWSLCHGLRAMLMGQLWDIDNDARSSTQTFTLQQGGDSTRKLVCYLIFPAEILFLVSFAILEWPQAPWFTWLVAAGFLWETARFLTFSKGPFDPMPSRGVHVPMHDFYQMGLPVGLAAIIAIQNPLFWPVPVVHVLFFYDDFRRRKPIGKFWKVCQHLRKTLKSITRRRTQKNAPWGAP